LSFTQAILQILFNIHFNQPYKPYEASEKRAVFRFLA